MNRNAYWREYHAKHRDKRRAQMLARYYAAGGHTQQKIDRYLAELKQAQQ